MDENHSRNWVEVACREYVGQSQGRIPATSMMHPERRPYRTLRLLRPFAQTIAKVIGGKTTDASLKDLLKKSGLENNTPSLDCQKFDKKFLLQKHLKGDVC